MTEESEPTPSMQPFAGQGELPALLRATDWSATPLGPVETWPRALVGYVRMVLEMPTPAVIFWGPEQIQIYNAGYATIMGPRHPTYFGAPYRDCWPDTYPTMYPWMRRVLDRGEVVQVEDEHVPVTRYGFEEEAYFTFTFSPLRDDAGVIQGIFQPVFEVTGRVLDERRASLLRQLEPGPQGRYDLDEMVRVIQRNPRDVPLALFYLCSRSAGRVELAGGTLALEEPAAERMAELAQGVFESRQPLELEHVELLTGAARERSWPEPVSRGLALPVGSSTDAARGVVVFGISSRLHFDRKYRNFLELTARQVMTRLSRGLERAARRQEAARQRQSLMELINQAPAGIAVLRGPDHVFEVSNPLYQQLIGEQRNVLGKPIHHALPELAGQPFYEVLDEVYRSGEVYAGTETAVHLDRQGTGATEERFFNFVYQPMRDSGGTVEGIVVFAYDVTEHVRARRRVEALMDDLRLEHRRKDQFLAMLAHELRNPLAAIHNAVNLLEQSDVVSGHGDLVQYAGILGRQTRNLARLVDDLLDVSRITRGLVELDRQPMDLADALERALECVQPLMEAKGHDVRFDPPAEGVTVLGDRVRLEQVLVNLLSNAAKFTDPGGHVEVNLTREDDQARCRVRDTGIGLQPDSIEEMFSLFGQAERGLDRSQGGLGIGLTVVRHLVELHGGTITAASEGPDTGSEFVVTLPLAPGADAEVSPPMIEQQAAATSGRRVLVVDDNADAADTLALLLRSAGHVVTVAYDGPEAVTEAQAHQPEVVLLDIGLPGMDGYEVARRLRHDGRTRGARIAAMTGYGQERDRSRTRSEDFDGHFVKPVDLATLMAFMDESAPDIPA